MVSGATFSQNLHAGLKAGADLHKISGTAFKDEFGLGYHIGAFAQVGFGNKINLQPEVLLSDVNTRTAYNFNEVYGFKDISRVRLQYLNIPVLLNVELCPFLTLQAGPQFGILIDKSKSLAQNGKDDFKTGDVGAVAGLQVNLSKFNIYGRYVAGLNDVSTGVEKWKNRTVQVGIGLKLF